MSPQSSDSLFESDDFSQSGGFDEPATAAGDSGLEQTAVPRTAIPVQKQPYSVYHLMLLMSLICMTAAAILFYIEIGRFSQP